LSKSPITIITTIILLLFSNFTAHAATHKYDELGRLSETTYDSGRTVRYSYDALGNMTLVEAEGTGELPDTFVITVTAGEGGAAVGGGRYVKDTEVTVTATPAPDYTFDGWYENDEKVPDAETTYIFAATANRTLQARFVRSETPPLTDAEAVAADKAALIWDVIRNANTIQTAVTTSLTLPTIGASGTAISWASTDPTVISTSGVVTRPTFTSGDANVTLTATISRGSASDTLIFNLTVTKLPETSPPKGEIKAVTHGWNSFINFITFGIFAKNTQSVTITAEDDSNETVTIRYYLSEVELTLAQAQAKL